MKKRVSNEDCEKITILLKKIEWFIKQTVEKAEKHNPNELEMTLIVYLNEYYKKYVAGFKDLPNSVHKAMGSRVYAKLTALDYKAGIIEFVLLDYRKWLRAMGFKDEQDVHSVWTAEYRNCIVFN